MAEKESKKEKKARKAEKKELKARENAEELEEIEIDLNGNIPLSKKQQRLLKKGKLNIEKLKKKHPAPKPENAEESEDEDKKDKPPARSKFGVWVGNLAFDTTKEDIIRFISAKTEGKITEDDISRFNMPKKGTKIKGFCYVDFDSQEKVDVVVGLSEQNLNGRNLLIKDSTSFEGRPEKSETLSKNPPSRILFVGNLSFDTTQDLLEEHFRHCGEIVRIRMATFEDSGKCKGFAFIDFKDEAGPTTALKSKLAKKMINRPLRLEYGEDRSKRAPSKRKLPEELEESHNEHTPAPTAPPETTHEYKPKPKRFKPSSENRRVTSSVALASAQRASAAIVPSSGKKITFD